MGQGDAILIEGPAGHRILVDGGPSGETVAAALGRHLPFYERRLDLVVLTHPQADHLAGLPEVLARYDVAGVLDSPAGDSSAYRAWRDAVRAEGAPRVEATRGQSFDLGDGARLTVLAPDPRRPPTHDPNEASVVFKLTMGRVAVLLTGDIDADAEAALVRSGADLRAAVLKLPHHGSDTSSSPDFLRRVDPLLDVVSVGAGNRFGQPSPQVLDRLRGDLVLRTDRHGDITVSTDGQHLWIYTQRRP
ncbi:MAG TPA: MBL fold metallo-hydrolase [Dehalococcoidia bacterium]|nr:MBL fold metallo-hydrolase [Dehalococcoidia bacterium]